MFYIPFPTDAFISDNCLFASCFRLNYVGTLGEQTSFYCNNNSVMVYKNIFYLKFPSSLRHEHGILFTLSCRLFS